MSAPVTRILSAAKGSENLDTNTTQLTQQNAPQFLEQLQRSIDGIRNFNSTGPNRATEYYRLKELLPKVQIDIAKAYAQARAINSPLVEDFRQLDALARRVPYPAKTLPEQPSAASSSSTDQKRRASTVQQTSVTPTTAPVDLTPRPASRSIATGTAAPHVSLEELKARAQQRRSSAAQRPASRSVAPQIGQLLNRMNALSQGIASYAERRNALGLGQHPTSTALIEHASGKLVTIESYIQNGMQDKYNESVAFLNEGERLLQLALQAVIKAEKAS